MRGKHRRWNHHSRHLQTLLFACFLLFSCILWVIWDDHNLLVKFSKIYKLVSDNFPIYSVMPQHANSKWCVLVWMNHIYHTPRLRPVFTIPSFSIQTWKWHWDAQLHFQTCQLLALPGFSYRPLSTYHQTETHFLQASVTIKTPSFIESTSQ